MLLRQLIFISKLSRNSGTNRSILSKKLYLNFINIGPLYSSVILSTFNIYLIHFNYSKDKLIDFPYHRHHYRVVLWHRLILRLLSTVHVKLLWYTVYIDAFCGTERSITSLRHWIIHNIQYKSRIVTSIKKPDVII